MFVILHLNVYLKQSSLPLPAAGMELAKSMFLIHGHGNPDPLGQHQMDLQCSEELKDLGNWVDMIILPGFLMNINTEFCIDLI